MIKGRKAGLSAYTLMAFEDIRDETFNLKKKLVCLLAVVFTVHHLSGYGFAEEAVSGETETAQNREEQTVVIPESDHIYVNGSSRVFTADGEISALLRLTVESPGIVLPKTGGAGTAIWSLAGGVMSALSGAMLIRRRKRRAGEA